MEDVDHLFDSSGWENDVPHKILNGQWNNGNVLMIKVCEPHIEGISANVPNIDFVLFLNQMKDEDSTMIMIPWKSVLKYLNCLKFIIKYKKGMILEQQNVG
jgi:hypothetical protein